MIVMMKISIFSTSMMLTVTMAIDNIVDNEENKYGENDYDDGKVFS